MFLDYLIGWLTNTPILLILLYRPEYTHPWGSKSYYTKIGLTQLGTASSSELVQAILEKGEVAPELSTTKRRIVLFILRYLLPVWGGYAQCLEILKPVKGMGKKVLKSILNPALRRFCPALIYIWVIFTWN
jgi:hypothetical protein